MNNKPISVLLADDHRIFRDGIASMLKDIGDIQPIGMASNGNEALELIERDTPDVVILDLSMPEMNGFEVLKRLKEMEVKPGIVILSMHTDLAWIKEAMALGANGYICKEDTEKGELLEAIREVAAGNTYFGPSVQRTMHEQLGNGASGKSNAGEPGLEVLSKREIDILRQVMEGMSNPEIADASFVSIRTVETHKNNIMTKLNLKNTVELVKYAIRKRFFEV
jgi:DNA-binding NarL/FixJ family response regulator